MEEQDKEGGEFDVRGYLRVVLDFRWLILLTTVVVGAATIVWTLNQPRVYEASTTIEYDPNPATPLGDDDPISGYLNAREYYETQNRRLRSRSMAEAVVRQLGLHEDPTFYDPDAERVAAPSIEEVAVMLRDRVEVQQVKETRIVALSVRDRRAVRAKDIANAYATIYVAQTRDDNTTTTQTALAELSTQVGDLREHLEMSEAALQQYKEENNIQSMPMEDVENILVNEITALSSALTTARQQRIAVNAHLSRLSAAVRAADVLETPIFDENGALSGLRQSLREKLAERAYESVTYGSEHPVMKTLEREIQALREQVAGELELILAGARGDLREASAVESGLRQALEEAQERSIQLDRHELQYRRLFRERENATNAYQRVTEARTDRSLVQSYQRVFAEQIDSALEPTYPVAPNRTANAIGGVVSGFVLGVLLAFGIRLMDRRIRTPEAIEALGTALIGVLPKVGSHEEEGQGVKRRRGRGRRPLHYPLVVHDTPMSAAAECCRTIRTNLTFMTAFDGKDAGRCLLITGSLPQEGKTTVSANLAAAFAQSGKKVLIIDADLRKPRIHEVFKASRDTGLTSFVVGELDWRRAVQKTHVPGLYTMTSGPVPPNPSELLHAERISQLITEAKKAYDIVLFDSPPLAAVTDAAILASSADGTLVVARAEVTTRDALRASLRQLQDVNARVLGVVLNDFDPSKDGPYGRGYYYQRYGSYEEESGMDEAAE